MRKSKYLCTNWMENLEMWPSQISTLHCVSASVYLMPCISCCTAFNRWVMAHRRTTHGITLYNLLTTGTASGATCAFGRMPYDMESWLPGMARFIIGISFNGTGIWLIHDFKWSTPSAAIVQSIVNSTTWSWMKNRYHTFRSLSLFNPIRMHLPHKFLENSWRE